MVRRSFSQTSQSIAILAAFAIAASCAELRICPGAFAAQDPGANAQFVSLLAPDLLNHTGVSGGTGAVHMGGPETGFDGAEFPPVGSTVDVGGVPFPIQRNASGADHYVPDGRPIALPAGTRRLVLAGARVFGGGRCRAAFDRPGGATEAVFCVNDWCEADRCDNREAARMSHRIFEGAVHEIECRLWAASFNVPDGATAVRFAADKDLHIFALVADTGAQPLWETRVLLDNTDRIPPLSHALPAPAPSENGDLPLGFVAHWNEKGVERYTENGASSMLMNVFVWAMRDRENQLVDFAAPEKWLAYLYRTGMKSAVIVDTSIHHTSIGWRSEATRALGENVVLQDGTQAIYSSPWSPRYREMTEQYVRDLTGWISKHDTAHQVTAYTNGAEVFWPGMLDYGPLAKTAFRKWLVEEYGSLDTINERWGAKFKNVDDIEPIPFCQVGRSALSPMSYSYPDWVDEAWTIDLTNRISKGMRYRVSVDVRADVAQDGQVFLEVVWRKKGVVERIDSIGCAGNTFGEWKHLEDTIAPPDFFDEATLQLTQMTTGRTEWRDPAVVPEHGNGSVIPAPTRENVSVFGAAEANPTAVWRGAHYGKAEIAQSTRPDDTRTVAGSVLLCMDAPAKTPRHGHDSAAWYDFVTFSMEGYARRMNDWALYIKKCDPSRKVMHYLGFTLGTLGQWDDSTLTQRADIFLANSRDADINGIQLCAAKGDFHYTTLVVDLARKYNKPIVATDLQDFTHGVYVGYNAMNRTTLASIAHGCDGIYYYCWYGTPDYNWHEAWTLDETSRMIRNARWTLEFLKDATLETDAAFVIPIVPYCEADAGGQKNDMLENMGLYTIAAKLGYCPEVFTVYDLAKSKPDLSRFKTVFLPDCLYINATACDVLSRYAEGGGVLILTGRPPTYDETGRPLESPLLPANGKVVERVKPGAARVFTKDAVALAGLDPRFAGFGLPGDTTVVNDAGEWAGLLRRKHGKGTLIHTGGMDGKGYLGPMRRYRVAGNTPPLFIPDEGLLRPEGTIVLDTLRDAIARSGVVSSARLDPPDPSIEVAVYRKEDEYRVVLIHTAPGMHHGGTLVLKATETHLNSDSNSGAVSKPEPRSGSLPEVLADFEPRPVKVAAVKDGEIRIPLPTFSDCCAVRW